MTRIRTPKAWILSGLLALAASAAVASPASPMQPEVAAPKGVGFENTVSLAHLKPQAKKPSPTKASAVADPVDPLSVPEVAPIKFTNGYTPESLSSKASPRFSSPSGHFSPMPRRKAEARAFMDAHMTKPTVGGETAGVPEVAPVQISDKGDPWEPVPEAPKAQSLQKRSSEPNLNPDIRTAAQKTVPQTPKKAASAEAQPPQMTPKTKTVQKPIVPQQDAPARRDGPVEEAEPINFEDGFDPMAQ